MKKEIGFAEFIVLLARLIVLVVVSINMLLPARDVIGSELQRVDKQ